MPDYSDRNAESPNEVFLKAPPQEELEKALGFPLDEVRLREFLAQKKAEREAQDITAEKESETTPERHAKALVGMRAKVRTPSPKAPGPLVALPASGPAESVDAETMSPNEVPLEPRAQPTESVKVPEPQAKPETSERKGTVSTSAAPVTPAKPTPQPVLVSPSTEDACLPVEMVTLSQFWQVCAQCMYV